MTDKTLTPMPGLAGWLDRLRFTAVPQRLKERRFWITQLLILVAVGTHYLAEILGATNPYGIFHGMSITVFVIPMVYASLAYGWEGAVFTAVWAFALILPSMGVFHRDPDHWGAEAVQLGTTLPVGLLVAWRVGKEKALTGQLERRADALELLNSVASRLSGSAGIRQQLPEVLRLLVSHLQLESAWLLIEPALGFSQEAVLFLPDGPRSAAESSPPLALHNLVAAGERGIVNLDGTVVAVRVASDTNNIGSLGVRTGGRVIEDEELNLLATVARQVGVSIRNVQLQLASQENLRSYAHQVTQAQEDERLRISRELHDVTAQELIQLVRTIEARRESETPPDAAGLAQLAEQVRQTLEGVRRYARNLRPSILDDLGLVPAIRMVVRDSEHLPADTSLKVNGVERRLEPPAELALFRIAQESLNNIGRHAEASSVEVVIEFEGDRVSLRVRDNGNGFEPLANLRDNAPLGRLGLIGMAERAERAGGSFSVSSNPGEGTTIEATVAA